MKDIEGVYAIHNLITGKKYIGQSVSIKNRWRKHLLELRNNKHHSQHLQHSFNKYGEKVFIFGVIEECDYKHLTAREQYWINYFDSYNNGYNSIETSIKGGRLFSEEDKLKQSIIGKNQWNKLSKKAKQERIALLNSVRPEPVLKKVTLYSKETLEKIQEFNSAIDCATYFKVSSKKMYKVIGQLYKLERCSYKGFILIKEDDDIDSWKERKQQHDLQIQINIEKALAIRRENIKPKKPLLSVDQRNSSWATNLIKAVQTKRDKQTKVLQIWDKEDNLITTVLTQKDAEKFTGVAGRYIDKVLRGDKKSYKGYIFKYVPRTEEYSHLR